MVLGFGVTQGHQHSYDFIFDFNRNHASILYRFWVITYFPKIKDVTWPWQWQFVIPMAKHHMANQCTKFEASHFSHSRTHKTVNGRRLQSTHTQQWCHALPAEYWLSLLSPAKSSPKKRNYQGQIAWKCCPKLRPGSLKMHQKAFGGQAPPGPAGGT